MKFIHRAPRAEPFTLVGACLGGSPVLPPGGGGAHGREGPRAVQAEPHPGDGLMG